MALSNLIDEALDGLQKRYEWTASNGVDCIKCRNFKGAVYFDSDIDFALIRLVVSNKRFNICITPTGKKNDDRYHVRSFVELIASITANMGTHEAIDMLERYVIY